MNKNTLFKDLRSDKYRSQIVKSKKGKVLSQEKINIAA
nr:MAG TPA: Alternative ribosome-rescue factor A [Caudoviricetes sp.]